MHSIPACCEHLSLSSALIAQLQYQLQTKSCTPAPIYIYRCILYDHCMSSIHEYILYYHNLCKTTRGGLCKLFTTTQITVVLFPTKGTNDCKFTVCVPVSVGVGHTGEQKVKGAHFCTLELQAFSFMLLEGGGQEMSVCVCVHVCHVSIRTCMCVCARARVCSPATITTTISSSPMGTEVIILPRPHKIRKQGLVVAV